MSETAKSKGGSTVAVVTALAEPIAAELGLRIWDVRFVKEGTMWYLRIFIDKDGGVDINDCEKMSRAIDGPLDEADPIEQSYCLEVSSPGIERELTKPEHFELMKGQSATVKLFRPVDGEREITGELVGMRDKQIVLKMEDGSEREIPKKDAVSVRMTGEY